MMMGGPTKNILNAKGDNVKNHNNNTGNTNKRGALIVLEGLDNTGKTTQANLLVESLTASGRPTILMKFPDRTTEIGKIINHYLRRKKDCDVDDRLGEDQVIHLLFSANRWECVPKIVSTLKSGISILADRYAFSGVAYSATKELEIMDLRWCKQSDVGLPKPDIVLFLDLGIEEARNRKGYGDERYEVVEFQKKVYANYMALLDDTYWRVIDADTDIEALHEALESQIIEIIDGVREKEERELAKLWV